MMQARYKASFSTDLVHYIECSEFIQSRKLAYEKSSILVLQDSILNCRNISVNFVTAGNQQFPVVFNLCSMIVQYELPSS